MKTNSALINASSPRILALAHTVWTERWLNRQQLLSRVGKRLPVLYSNAAWFTWDCKGDRWQQALWTGDFTEQDNVCVEGVPRWHVRSLRFPSLDRYIVRTQVRRWMRQLNSMGNGPLILQLFHPAFADYIDEVKPDALVYHPYDLYRRMPGWSDQMRVAERNVLARANLVVTSSRPTLRELEPETRAATEVIPNGVDWQSFVRAREEGGAEPSDLESIRRPRIGFVGSIQPTVDIDLVAALAEARPEWQFVFVGETSPGVSDAVKRQIEHCRKLGNVHFLGIKHRDQVPHYMLNFDVNTLLFRTGEGLWADVAHPLKLYEYMAAGRPIVSSDLESVREHAKLVRIATDAKSWEAAIEDALREQSALLVKERIETAKANSWDQRADALCDAFIRQSRLTV